MTFTQPMDRLITFEGSWSQRRDLQSAWRELPEAEQPYLVCFMGMLDYEILSVHTSEDEAQAVLDQWQRACDEANAAYDAWRETPPYERQGIERPEQVCVPSYTREALAHEFQIRQQHSLDALVHAIRSSY